MDATDAMQNARRYEDRCGRDRTNATQRPMRRLLRGIAPTTDSCNTSKNIAYPDPADMTEKLQSLARAAVRLYAHDGGTAGRLDDWFMTEFQLRVAMPTRRFQRANVFATSPMTDWSTTKSPM